MVAHDPVRNKVEEDPVLNKEAVANKAVDPIADRSKVVNKLAPAHKAMVEDPTTEAEDEEDNWASNFHLPSTLSPLHSL